MGDGPKEVALSVCLACGVCVVEPRAAVAGAVLAVGSRVRAVSSV